MPRVFEWNLMHGTVLANSCVDIDGVLCLDPTDEENDDGECYARFLRDTPALLLPTAPVAWLVTSRLEKYRKQTAEWLARHEVRYGAPTRASRRMSTSRPARGSSSRAARRSRRRSRRSRDARCSAPRRARCSSPASRPPPLAAPRRRRSPRSAPPCAPPRELCASGCVEPPERAKLRGSYDLPPSSRRPRGRRQSTGRTYSNASQV